MRQVSINRTTITKAINAGIPVSKNGSQQRRYHPRQSQQLRIRLTAISETTSTIWSKPREIVQ